MNANRCEWSVVRGYLSFVIGYLSVVKATTNDERNE